jgi:ferredoxin/nitrate reductase assembly molybdenum cofactor insertion protein NarJ
MSLSERVDMYTALAEALAEPPQWMCLPGPEWPLFDLAARLLPNSSALPGLALIGEEDLPTRQARYTALCAAQPVVWLYESAFLTGRILGEATFAVAKWYSQAGLEVQGSELPDGAAQELSFLAYLANNDPAAEKKFLKEHAAAWLPALGQSLARGSDPLYAAIGRLLSDWITQALTPVRKPAAVISTGPARIPRIPVMGAAPECTMCGFCAQRCPTAALTIRETSVQSELVLLAARCTGCGRCAAVCDAVLLSMQPLTSPQEQPITLRQSERVACKACGQPTVSRAEMDFVIKQIGHPDWLDYCPACRVPAFSGNAL